MGAAWHVSPELIPPWPEPNTPMPIVSVCPYCRSGCTVAADRDLGTDASCPRCRRDFVVIPTVDPPAWALAGNTVDPNAAPPAASPPRPRTWEAPAAETRPHLTDSDITEPSPVLKAESEPVTPISLAAPVFEPEAAPGTAADTAFVLGLVAAILFGAGLLATLLPFGRAIGLVLTGAGLLLALVAALGEGRAKWVGIGVVVLNAGAVLALLVAPGWFRLDPWQGAPAVEAPAVQAVNHDTGTAAPADWVDGEKASWEAADVRVTVHGAFVGPVELVGPKGAKRKTKESGLQISLRLANSGVERRIPLTGWAGGATPDGVRLIDPAGKEVRPKTFPAGWVPDAEGEPHTGLFPGKTANVLLVFDVSSGGAGSFQLELAGAAVGLEPPVRFRLSSAFLGVRP